MSSKTLSDAGSGGGSAAGTAARDAFIVLQGNLKKLKTNKRRYFVLFRESPDQQSRLDYFENEKKFRHKYAVPKRSIVLKSCFHIDQRRDTKHKYVISLYTKDDCFGLVMDSEADMGRWMRAMQELHSDQFKGDKTFARFDQVWQVQVQRKGLAEERGLVGNYHLCLTSAALSLVRIGTETTSSGEERREHVEFPLTTIRRCGDSQCFFYMEVGRFSSIGSGELWMGTEAPLIAQNMHTTIMNAMSVCSRDELGPIVRGRSSSANEASKPITMLHRRQTHVGNKPLSFSPVSADSCEGLAETDSIGGPSSPLSTSTLSGSGATVILMGELSASRTSTPLRVVQPIVQPKHGFHVAAQAQLNAASDEYMECSPAAGCATTGPHAAAATAATATSHAPPAMASCHQRALSLPSTAAPALMASSDQHQHHHNQHHNHHHHQRHFHHPTPSATTAPPQSNQSHHHHHHHPATVLPPPPTQPTPSSSQASASSASTPPPPSATTNIALPQRPAAEYVPLSAPQPPPHKSTTLSAGLGGYTLKPFHQRTRSLPLTEETAIEVHKYHTDRLDNAAFHPQHRASSNNNNTINNNNNNNNHHKNPNANHYEPMSMGSASMTSIVEQQQQQPLPASTSSEAFNVPANSVLRQLLASIDVAALNGSNADMLKLLSASVTTGVPTGATTTTPAVGGGSSHKRCKRLLSPDPPPQQPETSQQQQHGVDCVDNCVGGDCLCGADGSCGGVCLSSRNPTGRERCDSLPSRARTISETTTAMNAAAAAAAAAESAAMPPPPPPRVGGLLGLHHHHQRPMSLYQHHTQHHQRHSSSPPPSGGGGALSPSMVGCSESDGSSLSIDETDGYGSHSMTPEESHPYSSRYYSSRTSGSVIPEENGDECWQPDANAMRHAPSTSHATTSSAAHPHAAGSLSLAIQAQHSTHSNIAHAHHNGGSNVPQPGSSVSSAASAAAQLLSSRKGSPSAASSHSFMGRYSPCGSSPGDNQMSAGAYMLMSPRDESKSLYTNSSGASSLAEDLYVPNDPPPPLATDEYMDMMEQSNSRLNNSTSGMNSVASSCSITSGTPSTDLRFGEYQLDKVISIFTPDEDEPSLQADRPARAYSVGSRLEHNKRKLLEHPRQPTTADNHNTKSSRLRAFSVGAKVPRSDSYRGVIQKAPLSTVFMKKDANAVNNNQKSASVSTLHTYREQHQMQQQQLGSSPHQQQMLLHHQLLQQQQQQHHQNAVSSLPSNDGMDDLMEMDFTSSSATSSGPTAAAAIAMDEDVCGSSPATSIDVPPSGPTLVKSQPMSVPLARKLGDDHHPQLQTGSRGIDPPNGYVPMRPSLKTSSMGSNISGSGISASIGSSHRDEPPSMPTMLLNSTGSSYSSNSYMCMKPVGAGTAAATPQLSPSTSSFPYHHSPKTSTIVAASVPTAALGSSLGRSNNNAGTIGSSHSNSDYLPMSPQQNHATVTAMAAAATAATAAVTAAAATTPSTPVAPSSAPEGYMEMKWIKPTAGVDQHTAANTNNNRAYEPCNNDSSPTLSTASPRLASMPININHPPRKSTLELHNEQRKHIGSMSLAVKSRVRCDSKDSGIMTPTGSSSHSSSIFPFSPSSPKSHHQTAFAVSVPSPTATANRKCLIDATNGTLHLASATLDEGAEGLRAAVTAASHRGLIEQPKVQNKDQTPMQVDTLSSDYADMTLEPKSTATAASSTSTPFTLAAITTPAPLTAQLPQRSKPSNLQRPALSSARETTNADYTLMKPSYPYPKKKPLLVQINNNLTNATTKTNATAFRSIAASGGGNGGSGSTTPSTPPLGAAASTSGSGPYEMLLARPNSVAQEKVTAPSSSGAAKQLNTMPLMRSTSANSERMQLSPIIVQPTAASSGCSSQSNSPIVTGSSSATTSSSSSTSTLCGEQMAGSRHPQQRSAAASLANVMLAVQRASSNDSASGGDDSSNGSTADVAIAGISRPPSVSSERELYYASLDLPSSASTSTTTTTANSNSSGTTTATASVHSTPGTPTSADEDSRGAAVSCSPAAQPATAAGIFSYAQIDFVKCGEQIKTPGAIQTQTSVTSMDGADSTPKATTTMTTLAGSGNGGGGGVGGGVSGSGASST